MIFFTLFPELVCFLCWKRNSLRVCSLSLLSLRSAVTWHADTLMVSESSRKLSSCTSTQLWQNAALSHFCIMDTCFPGDMRRACNGRKVKTCLFFDIFWEAAAWVRKRQKVGPLSGAVSFSPAVSQNLKAVVCLENSLTHIHCTAVCPSGLHPSRSRVSPSPLRLPLWLWQVKPGLAQPLIHIYEAASVH